MFVAIAASERLVSTLTTLATRTIAIVRSNPAWPVTKPKRRNMTTPRIVSTLGVNTPPNVPSLARSGRGSSVTAAARSPAAFPALE